MALYPIFNTFKTIFKPMYGFNQNTPESTVTTALKAGINEDVFLQKVEFASMSEGKDPVLQITFGNSSGILRSVIWAVTPESITVPDGKVHKRDVPDLGFVKGQPVTREDAVKMEFDNFNVRLKHIATKFVSEEEANIQASSYADFCQKYVALLSKPEFAKIPVRLKVTLNTNDYSQLPKYPPFIEEMSVPREQTKLRITNYDKVVATTSQSATPTPASAPFDFDGDASF